MDLGRGPRNGPAVTPRPAWSARRIRARPGASTVRVDRPDLGLTWNQMGMASMNNTVTVHAVFAKSECRPAPPRRPGLGLAGARAIWTIYSEYLVT